MRWMVMPLVLALAAPVATSAAGPSGKKVAKYDPSTVVTVQGTVLGETRTAHGNGPKAVRLVIKTAEGQVPVHLGPDAWVDAQKVKLHKGDEVTVKGSRFTYEDKYGLIAQSVTRGGETLVVRDASGKPAWSKGAKN